MQASNSPPLYASPVIPALLAELLIGKGKLRAALALLVDARDRFPGDLRLGQLRALCLSRGGDLEAAMAQLLDLEQQAPNDEETLGILGGAWKRAWAQAGLVAHLQASHRCYSRAWKASRAPYAGVNAAATALWLDDRSTCRRIASEVAVALDQTRAQLALRRGDPAMRLSFWDSLTLAEAELLRGELALARHHYRAAFSAQPDRTSDEQVARTQLTRNLSRLSLGLDDRSFLAGAAGQSPRSQRGTRQPRDVVVSVCGHRSVSESTALGVAVRAGLARVHESLVAVPHGRVIVLSSLAEGADRLLAVAALEQLQPAVLRALLPCEIDEAMSELGSDESRAALLSLLQRADGIETVLTATTARRPAAPEDRYVGAARALVERADVVVALWDGEPARGPGGTGETVQWARERGHALVWIDTAPPHHIRTERMDALAARPRKQESPMYVPRPFCTHPIVLSAELRELIEQLAQNAHETWAQQRVEQGWSWGPERNDAAKQHPCIVPYQDLPESEKDVDRRMAEETVKMILVAGWRIDRAE